MSGNGNQVPPSQRGSGPYPRAPTPHRPECYHPSGPGTAYMPSTAGGAQGSAQAALRVQSTPQPSAPPAPQQDMKTTMAGHNYAAQQNQTQSRPPYSNYQFGRTAQHGSRPNHRQQQPSYITGATPAATGTVMYHPHVLYPPSISMQPYPQPRSTTPGYYPYMQPQYLPYTPPNHSTQYEFPVFPYGNGPQLPASNLAASSGARSNPSSLVGPPGTAAPTAPTPALPHQAPAHMHAPMPGTCAATTKRSHRIAIINPDTNQEVTIDSASKDNQYLSGESSERQTPQPQETTSSSAREEFARKINEVANQPTSSESSIKSNHVTKNVDMPVPSAPSATQPQSNAINSINNNIAKSEILPVNDTKSLGPDVAAEPNETPVVSAISDSPVIVPKMPINFKPIPKNSEQNVQSLVVDTNKNVPLNKQPKQNKNKPVVPQTEEGEKVSEASGPAQETAPSSVRAASPPPPAAHAAAAHAAAAAPVTAPGAALAPVPAQAHAVAACSMLFAAAPQPQRLRADRLRADKDKSQERELPADKEPAAPANKHNGPTPAAPISSVDSFAEVINLPTSQSSQAAGAESTKKNSSAKQFSPAPDSELGSALESKIESKVEAVVTDSVTPPTDRFTASIEKLAFKEPPSVPETIIETEEASKAIQAQAKLNQSIASCRNHPESKMKDINLNNKTTDPDTANGNTADVTKTETVKEDINKNEKVVKNTKNSNKKSNKMANNDVSQKEAESYENGKDETDKVSNVEQEKVSKKEESPKPTTPEAPSAPPVFVPKYKYSDDQWSPLNKSGKKCYDIGLLKQIKDDPLSKNKPNAPLLEALNVIRSAPMQDMPLQFSNISRPMNDSLMPQFAKPSNMGSRSNTPRDTKRDGRNMMPSGKGSVKLSSTPGGSNPHKPVIHVSLSLRDEVKLNEVDQAWKPSRFRKETVSEQDIKTEELYKKFRGILNKLTPQKFDTLMERVKSLEINNQKRLEGVIELVFEKAIDEPNFSEAYAAMCNKLSMLKVPADNATTPDQCVNFRALIISRCQNQFVTDKVDEQVLKLEKDLAECTDPTKKKELQLQLEEENRRVRMRSVGNVRFIGELYKLKMLTSKIMVYCMNYLIEKLEEEKLECLCKLLTTIGEQVESEVKDQLEIVFRKMQDIVDRKSNKITSRVRFMLQDVIELRARKWVIKSVVDSQPKMMDQIQKEAEQQQRHIELMNAPMGGFRRDDGGRPKRGDNRRNNSNSFMDNTWKSTRITVDTSKLKAATTKNLSTIKLAPHNSAWNHGSGAKSTTQTPSSNSMISLSKNMYSVLENSQTDPSTLRSSKDMTPSYSKGASIERSTFNSRGDFNSGSGGRGGSAGGVRSTSGSRSTSAAAPTPPAPATPPPPPAPLPQEPLPVPKKKKVKSMIELGLISPDDDEIVAEVKQLFPPQYHASVVGEILNVALEKSAKDIFAICKTLLHLVATGTISADNFLAGTKEILEFSPDLYIDIPMLYEYLGKLLSLQIEKKHITFVQVHRLCDSIIAADHGHLLLKAIVKDLKESMGPTFVKSKWQESNLQLKDWMNEDQVAKWLEDNKFEFLEGGAKASEESKKILTPAETQSKLLQLMNSDENWECIKGWVQDNVGASCNSEWFMRALIQAVCEHALFGSEARGDVPHFNQDRMCKYVGLINEFGDSRQAREASCLFGIQQLIHRLVHPQGLTLEIFQYLHEQYIISVEGFIAWEESEMEPEGKGVMMKALTSFFTNIKEADNEDSGSED